MMHPIENKRPYGHQPHPQKSKPAWVWFLPLVVVALAAAIAIPVVAIDRAKTDSAAPTTTPPPAPPVALQTWQLTAADVPAPDERIAAWVPHDVLVILAKDSVTAYSCANGAQRWKKPVSKGNSFCGAAPPLSAIMLHWLLANKLIPQTEKLYTTI